MPTILERLTQSKPVLLDGATGSELTRRGVDTSVPLWSAAALLTAPELVQQIHTDYVTAGAEIITANTFRTHARNLAPADMKDRAGELTRLAVSLARQAASGKAWVAGSLAPLEDCYRPDRVPDNAALDREHAQMARHLSDTGVDLILVETQNTIREAVAAARAVAATRTPLLVSFVCGRNGRLLSGEPISQAASAVRPFAPLALLVNCQPADTIDVSLKQLRMTAADLPCGAYGNIGRPDFGQGWINDDRDDPQSYAVHAKRWLDAGATLIGGCCGTTPGHIRLLKQLMDRRDAK